MVRGTSFCSGLSLRFPSPLLRRTSWRILLIPRSFAKSSQQFTAETLTSFEFLQEIKIKETFAIRDGQFREDIHYRILEKVGSGCFRLCYKATTNSGSFTFCLKMTGYSINEILALQLARKENITQVVGYFGTKLQGRKAVICMEYMAGGTVGKYVDTRMAVGEGPVPEKTCFAFVKDILQALKFLHEKVGIVHRDIHGGNVLLDGHCTHVKLADFGSAQAIQKPRDWSDDIWKTGCLLLFMLNGKISPLIFAEGSENERQSSVIPGKHFPSQAPEYLSLVFAVGREGLLSANQLLETCFLKEK